MEVFDEDGWFHTGDVALMLPDGALMIVDRVKNLVKLKSGEYIALEAMEKDRGVVGAHAVATSRSGHP